MIKQAQKEIVKYLDIGIVGDKTAMIDSLVTSINILKDKKSKSNIIIPSNRWRRYNQFHSFKCDHSNGAKIWVKIYTIGIGESNKIMLENISKEHKRQNFRANSQNDLKKVYETIDKLEKSKIDNNRIILKEYFFFLSLFISILALTFTFF